MNLGRKTKILMITLLCLVMASIVFAIGKTKNVGWGVLNQLNYRTGLASPALQELNGSIVRVPGYIVPLDGDEKAVTEFLLVPTLGACIHVPPPPPNQIIHVLMEPGVDVGLLFMPVWITGQLTIAHKTSELAEASYSMDGLKAEEYEF